MHEALGKAAPDEPLAAFVPADGWYIRSRDLRALFRLVDEIDEWGAPLAQLIEERGEDRAVAARYEAELGIERLARRLATRCPAPRPACGRRRRDHWRRLWRLCHLRQLGTEASRQRRVLRSACGAWLTECVRHMHGRLVPTFRNPRGGRLIHQMDHLFVSAAMLRRLVKCTVGEAATVLDASLSDHLPIIADFADQ